MQALTIHQPWATLLAIRAKTYETRSWKTSYRGPILIHAGRRFPDDVKNLTTIDPFFTALRLAGITPPAMLPLGALIGIAEITDCQPTEKLDFEGAITPQERNFGDFRPGRWAWKIDNARAFPEPVKFNGRRGLYEVPDTYIPEAFRPVKSLTSPEQLAKTLDQPPQIITPNFQPQAITPTEPRPGEAQCAA